ncbi:MAG TPA: metalloregulator ArsR/SmtB family transcription factor [Candidatus Saccharimonadales bacterium]
MQQSTLQQKFNALGDPTRYALVVSMIKREQLCVSELAEKLTMTPAAVSQHMRILEEANIIVPTRSGRRVCYTLNADCPGLRSLAKLMKQEELYEAK